MLKRLVFTTSIVLFLSMQVSGVEGEMETLPAKTDEQVIEQQPVLPIQPDVSHDDEQKSPERPTIEREDATTNPQQVM